jgi:CRP/FNR family transcriptional regulator, cyclic AMP receptor protein
MISRETALGEHVAFELLTPGDVLLLAGAEPDDLDLGARVTLTALDPAELIVLSTRFIHAAARWPSLLTNLHRRLDAQRQRLAVQGLAAHLPRAEDRLLLTLWILAHRCGRVTPEGIVLPLPLSHEVLGRLVAARRPTITLAMRTLESTECVQRGRNGYLTLGPAAHRKVQELTHAGISRLPIGPSVALHPPRPD